MVTAGSYVRVLFNNGNWYYLTATDYATSNKADAKIWQSANVARQKMQQYTPGETIPYYPESTASEDADTGNIEYGEMRPMKIVAIELVYRERRSL